MKIIHVCYAQTIRSLLCIPRAISLKIFRTPSEAVGQDDC